MTKKQIYGFILGLLAVSWLFQFLVLQKFGTIEAPGILPFILVIMFLPGLFGLGFTIFSKNVRRSVEWKPAGPFALTAAILVPIFIAFAAIGFLIYSGLGASDYFQFTRDGATIASGPWLLGTGVQTWPMFVANIFVTALIYAVLTSLATIGEEYGWRGVLQNAMLREFGFGKGVAILGFVWAIWHIPIILAGHNYPETPVLGAFVFMPLLLIAASFIMAWLTLWNRSFWPAVLMHGAINSVYDSMITKVTLAQANPYTMPIVEIGLFAVLAIFAYLAARSMARRLM